MPRNNTGLLVIAGLGALLLLSKGKNGLEPGATVVKGSLNAVNVAQGPRMGSHKLLKAPGDVATTSAVYSVAAFKNGDEAQPISWPYKFFIAVAHGNDVLYSNMSAVQILPKMDNQVWAGEGFAYLVGQDVLNGWLLSVTVQIHGAVSNADGTPSTSFTLLASKVHLDAIEIVAQGLTVVTGAIGVVNVAQGSAGRRGPFFAPPPFSPPGRGPFRPQETRSRGPFYAPPPGGIPPKRGPIYAPPPFKAGQSDNPWLHMKRAPI